MNERIYTYFVNLPCSIGAFTVACEDCYSIIVNARSSYDRQQESIQHELEHIRNGDFDFMARYSTYADDIERLRHAMK